MPLALQMILALDPSRVLGWCRGEPGERLAYGHIELARKGATPGVIGWALEEFLADTFVTVGPDLVVYEKPFRGPSALTDFIMFGMCFCIDTEATRAGIEYASVIGVEATRALTGRAKFPGENYTERRKAKKSATIAACCARGWAPTEDEADAIAVFLLAEQKRFPKAALSRPRALKQPTGPLFTEAPRPEHAIAELRRRLVAE